MDLELQGCDPMLHKSEILKEKKIFCTGVANKLNIIKL